MKTGIELIAEERARQITAEGWTAEHDDIHTSGELAEAAVCYAKPDGKRRMLQERVPVNTARGLADPDSFHQVTVLIPAGWPWHAEWWKPTDDRMRELVKAGALIAAEIDRLQRLSSPNNKLSHEAAK